MLPAEGTWRSLEVCPGAAPSTGARGRTARPQATPAAVTRGQDDLLHLQPPVLDLRARLLWLPAPVCPGPSPQRDADGFWGGASGHLAPNAKSFGLPPSRRRWQPRCWMGTGKAVKVI